MLPWSLHFVSSSSDIEERLQELEQEIAVLEANIQEHPLDVLQSLGGAVLLKGAAQNEGKLALTPIWISRGKDKEFHVDNNEHARCYEIRRVPKSGTTWLTILLEVIRKRNCANQDEAIYSKTCSPHVAPET